MCSIKVDLSNLPPIFSVLKPFERFWICRFFRYGFGYASFSDLDLDMQVFQGKKAYSCPHYEDGKKYIPKLY